MRIEIGTSFWERLAALKFDGHSSRHRNYARATADEPQEGTDYAQDPRFAGTRLWLHYVDANGESSERNVRVYNLSRTQNADYLTGFCELRMDVRSFRIDRIVEVADADGEVHDPKEFFAAFLPPLPGRSSGPSRRSGFGRALKLVDEVGDMVRVLVFAAEIDRRFGNKEADIVLRFVTDHAETKGLDITKRELTDFRKWMKLLKPDAQTARAALARVAQKGLFNADDVWQLVEIVLAIDGKINDREMEAAALIRQAIHESFT